MTTAEFASLLLGAARDHVRPDIVEAARLRIFDTLGTGAVGLHTDEGQAIRQIVGASPKAWKHLAAEDLIRLLAVAIRCTEIDDINVDSCTTVGSVVVPAALAAARIHPGTNGGDLLAGITAGYEAMVRLGEAIGGASILYRGVWPTYVTAPFAAAATAAAIWKLKPRQTANALSLALARTSILTTAALNGVSPRSWLLAMACCEGYAAARAAASGLGGTGNELEAFSARLGIVLDSGILLREMSGQPAILRIDAKPYPTARQSLSAIEAFRAKLPLAHAPEEIAGIEVRVPEQVRAMIARPPKGRIDSMVSVAYQMALAAYAPERLHDVLRAELLQDADILAFMDKVNIVADPDLTARFPAVWGARVRIRRASGDEDVSEVLNPVGSAIHRFGWDGVAEKLATILRASGAGVSGAIEPLERECRTLAALGNDGPAQRLWERFLDLSGL